MSRPRMRPQFRLPVPRGKAGLMKTVEAMLRAEAAGLRGTVHRDQASLHVPLAEEKYFSPVLNLTLNEADGGLELFGRFSPHPHVWMMFVAIYFVIGLGGLCGLVFGLSQWMMNTPPWGLLGVPGALALAAFVSGAAFIGQGFSAEQMYVLRAFVDRALEQTGEGPQP